MTRSRLVFTVAYAAVVAALAGAGATRSAVPLVIAALLILPSGLVAFVGVYVVYGGLVVVSRSLGARVMEGNGWSPHWFVVVDEVLVTALFAAAAVTNAVLAYRVIDNWRDRHSFNVPPDGKPSAPAH
jgi:hypothetical protein